MCGVHFRTFSCKLLNEHTKKNRRKVSTGRLHAHPGRVQTARQWIVPYPTWAAPPQSIGLGEGAPMLVVSDEALMGMRKSAVHTARVT